MTLFKNKKDNRLYTIEDHGLYGLYAYQYCFTGRVLHLRFEELGEKFIPVATI